MRIGEAKNLTDLVAALETARQRRLERRRGFETMWWNNIALVTGDHYASWNPSLSKYEDRDPGWGFPDDKKPRMVINHALTVGRTELAKLTKAHPIMEVIANSDESTDISAAKVGRSALDYAEWKFRLRKKRRQALWWMIQTGLGGLYVGWDHLDSKAGEYQFIIDPATGDPTFLPSRQKELRTMVENGELDELTIEKFPLGEVEYKVYSPFQLLPDETVLDFSEIKDLITTDVVNIDILQAQVGRNARDLRPDTDLSLGVIERRMIARAGVHVLNPMDMQVDDAIAVHSWWCLPDVYTGNKFLKDGIFVRWCSGRNLLDNTQQFPFQDGRMPFVFYQHIQNSTSIWPDSVMTHIRGPNLEIDKTVSQLIENKDYMSNPMWRVATQHKIRGQIKNVAGSIVRYRHVPNIPPPEQIPGIQMPAQVENILKELAEQILEISGQSEVARGRVPTGVRSGVAVAYLQEEDDTKLAPTIENMEEEIAMAGSLTLERFAQFYTLTRTLRFYRRDGAFDVLRFKGADLKNNTDVICQAGSAMPRSKAARQQYVLELVSLGIEKDPHWIKSALELGEGEPDDTDKAISQANRENNTMLHGSDLQHIMPPPPGSSDDAEAAASQLKWTAVAVPVKEWHNHEVHIQRHTSVTMDEEFDRLTITHPEIVRLFDEHIAMHQQVLQKRQQEQMQMMLAAKGAPEAPGAATNGGPPGAADQSGGGDQPQVAEMSQLTDVPDVIGRGVTRSTALRTNR
jgi:hypothetical protein